MLPDDTDFNADDGNEEITHDLFNALELSVDGRCASGTAGITYPAPTGTSLPWGGGKILVFQNATGVGPVSIVPIDDTLDYRNRIIRVLEAGLYAAANTMPGGAAWVGAGDMGYDAAGTPGAFWTDDGDDDSPVVNYYTVAPNALIWADSDQGYALYFYNADGVDTVYPFIVLWVSDQFPTRVP